MTEPGPASRIGQYQLISPIGAGGMGRVWVALDTAAPTLRLVALKTTLGNPSSSIDGEFWAMLADEAGLASRIDHPNVCSTFELGRDHNIHFLVMEWSDGASLRDVLDAAPGKRIAPELAAFIATSVAAGLHAAHELTDDEGHPLGVVHRDVSPQNVLVSIRGHVRLADFGVAKARGQQHRPTETGEVKGKLSYMAPEQVTSKNIDRRADIFALGCVLYEATLGVRPFHGADALATMYKILEQDLTLPRSVDPNFPEELERILVKTLAKDPNERYQTAEEMREALIDYLSSLRRPFADKHVAELLGGALGDSLRERNRAIWASAEQLKKGETDPARLQTPSPPAATQTLTPDGGLERSVTVLSQAKSWKSTVIVSGAVAAAAVALLAVWNLRGPSSPSTPAPPTTAAAVASPPTNASAPPAADVPGNPPSPPLAPVASAPPAVGVAAASAGGRRPVIRAPARTPEPVASASSAPQATKAPTRKPRPIDRDNPFAPQSP